MEWSELPPAQSWVAAGPVDGSLLHGMDGVATSFVLAAAVWLLLTESSASQVCPPALTPRRAPLVLATHVQEEAAQALAAHGQQCRHAATLCTDASRWPSTLQHTTEATKPPGSLSTPPKEQEPFATHSGQYIKAVCWRHGGSHVGVVISLEKGQGFVCVALLWQLLCALPKQAIAHLQLMAFEVVRQCNV